VSEKYRVVIPDEVYAVLDWRQEDLPAIGVVNQAMAGFEPKVVYAWHLSIIVEFQELAGNGMPTPEEEVILEEIGEEFGRDLKAGGNALFLAQITWNGTKQFFYRVYDPEVANRYLSDIIEAETQRRHFDFRMVHDETWEHAKWYLANFES
jgi:Family of unknown function (DUF695)